MNGSQNALVVIVCAHAYLCVSTRTKKSGTTTQKRGGLDKEWVRFKAKTLPWEQRVCLLRFLVLQKGTGFKKGVTGFSSPRAAVGPSGCHEQQNGPQPSMQEGSQTPASFPALLPPGSWAGALRPALQQRAREDPAVPKGSYSCGCSARTTTPNLARTARCSREQPRGAVSTAKSQAPGTASGRSRAQVGQPAYGRAACIAPGGRGLETSQDGGHRWIRCSSRNPALEKKNLFQPSLCSWVAAVGSDRWRGGTRQRCSGLMRAPQRPRAAACRRWHAWGDQRGRLGAQKCSSPRG